LRFEEGWKVAARRPRLEDYLGEVPPVARGLLLRELLALELAYRLRYGECPSAAEYERRFPAEAQAVREVFAEAVPPAVPPHREASPAGPAAAGSDAPRPPATDLPDAALAAVAAPPGYEVLEELGRGGMGVVYKARQVKANRLVALKVILAARHAGPAELARFRTEVEAIGRLQHPNIVQVYEVGEEDGKPFFSLELCAGGSLDRRLTGNPQPPAEAARLVEVLARAMRAAHERHVIHRDLKPANILLTEDGTPKISDFGLAKKLDDAGQTVTGAIMGTPSYMPPEQATGKTKELGPAADIYALGAILYECLTGRPPFKADTPYDTLLQVVSQEPVPPRQLNAKVPTDLQTVCLKCLHKEPKKRYASARALAEDCAAFLEGRPIQARQAGLLERSVKWARRRPAAAALLGVSLLATAAVLLSVGIAFVLVTRSRDDALGAEQRALRLAAEKGSLADANARLANRERRARQDAQEAFKREEAERKQKEEELLLARSNLFTAQLLRVKAVFERDPDSARRLLHDYNACPLDLRDTAWHFYERACRTREPVTLATGQGAFRALAFARNGRTLAWGGTGGSVTLWDPATGGERAVLKGHKGEVRAVAFSPDDGLLASGGIDGTVRLWDPATGRQRAVLQAEGPVWSVAFSPDGKVLASTTSELARGTEQAGLVGLLASGHPSAPLLAAVGLSRGPGGVLPYVGALKLWDSAAGRQRAVLRGTAGAAWSLAFSPDGKALAGGGYRVVRLWDLATGRLRWVASAGPAPYTGGVVAVAFSPDGRLLAGAGYDRGGAVAVWAAATGRLLGRIALGGPLHRVRALAFSPDGKTLAIGSADQSSRGRSPPSSDVGSLSPLNRPVTGRVHLVDLAAGGSPLPLGQHAGAVLSVAFSPDGKSLASAGGEKRTSRLPRLSGRLPGRLSGLPGRLSGEEQPAPAEVRLWGISPDQEKWVLQGHKEWVNAVALSGPFRKYL
jgi:WD40 repeat protein/tRNA A-37 threonylcarbamoyl transferase component Bud32